MPQRTKPRTGGRFTRVTSTRRRWLRCSRPRALRCFCLSMSQYGDGKTEARKLPCRCSLAMYSFGEGSDRRLQVVTTPGIHTILFHGERVAMIPGAEIEAIRKAVEGPFRVEPHPFLKCGERVRVIRGSLQGVEGVLVRKKNLYRLVLSVDMMAKSVAVEIDATDVEPAPTRNSNGHRPRPAICGNRQIWRRVTS